MPVGCLQVSATMSASGEESEEEELSPDEYQVALLADWRLAAVVQFTRCFAEPLEFTRLFPAEQLEAALCQPYEHLVFLGELVHRLVTSKPFSPDLGEAAWPLLQQAAKSRLGRPADLDFFSLSPTRRV